MGKCSRIVPCSAFVAQMPCNPVTLCRYLRTTVNVAHFSIKEYLISSRTAEGPGAKFFVFEIEAQLHISDLCLAYNLAVSEKELASEQTIEKYHLWEYVGKNWWKHLDKVPRPSWKSSTIEHMAKTFAPISESFLCLVRINSPEHSHWEHLTLKIYDLPRPLHWAASIEAIGLIDFLLEAGAAINEVSPHMECGTALTVAAFYAQRNAVQYLLGKNCGINARDHCCSTILPTAIVEGKDTQTLNSQSANVCSDVSGNDLGNALQAAACGHDEEMMDLLLSNQADINEIAGKYGTALQVAILSQEMDSVKFLLKRGAMPNLQAGFYGNALQAAIATGELNVAKLFISYGAELCPEGQEWDDTLARVHTKMADRLCKFRENPSLEYLDERIEQIAGLGEERERLRIAVET